jgi:Protein of unknown function (DUF3300)
MKKWHCAVVVRALLTLAAPLPVGAAAEAGQATKNATETIVAESDDIRALVAPVALYPDPILALVLQASTLPLQVVQADRFLTKREKDKTLAPDPDWDKSIIALLNYPRQVRLMSEYLDWTEELGDRVVDDLDAVQAAIQDIRLAAYDADFLKSDAHQKVELRDDQIRITLTDPQTVRIPRYDPAVLLTALDDIEEADASADEVLAASASPAPPAATSEQAVAPARQQPPPTQLATAPPAQTSAPPPAPPAVLPSRAPAATPVTSPVIVYGEPENTFWSNAASFAGGAVVGGLLGWGLTEAFDDDHDHWDEDDWDNEDVEEALRERREFREERRDDVLAARNQRLDTRRGMADERQANRNAIRAEREGDRDQRQAERQAQSGERRAERDQRGTERQGGREERQAEREGGRAARGESREERATRAREQLNERPEAVGGRTKPVAAESPGPRQQQAGAQRGTRDIKLPNAGTQADSADTVRQRSAARGEKQPAVRPATAGEARLTPARQQRAPAQAGYARPSTGQGIAAGAGNRREVRAEANRGAQSRGAAPRAAEAGQRRAAPVVSGRGGGGGTMIAQAPQRRNAGGGGDFAADRSRGFAARADSDRGRMSRGGAGGGGRRGR